MCSCGAVDGQKSLECWNRGGVFEPNCTVADKGAVNTGSAATSYNYTCCNTDRWLPDTTTQYVWAPRHPGQYASMCTCIHMPEADGEMVSFR
jgi:hypothetical protein